MRRYGMRWAALWIALVSCVSPNHVVCDEGHVCPDRYTCTPTGCVSPDQYAACDGVEESGSCELDLGTGRCVNGVCIVAICGNKVIELDEACDDGNTEGGDMCSATCSSTEECGNGIVDPAEECDGGPLCTACKRHACGNGIADPGEECDDGNQISGDGCHEQCLSDETCGNGFIDVVRAEQCDDNNASNNDGCSSSCRVELLAWQRFEPGDFTREGLALAYDAARRRVVMFGGDGPTLWGETWEYDGVGWIRRFPATSPPPRKGHAMAYDAKRGRVVMFGGDGGVPFQDTWEYDGVTWTQRVFGGTKPTSRHGHAMTYDAVRERVVLFGGYDPVAGAAVRDAWEFDGTKWEPRTGINPPPGRFDHAMAFDPVRAVIVVFGGNTGSPSQIVRTNDTWELASTATTWTSPAVTGSPAVRIGHTMAFHAGIERIVLHGGQTTAFGATLGDTYTYNGSTWSALGSGTPRREHAMAYDTHRERLVVVGGVDSDDSYIQATHEHDGASWSTAVAGTPQLVRPPIAYDAARGRSVMFGANLTQNALAETWELADARWEQRTTSGAPTARFSHALAYDSRRQQVVLFGGRNSAGGPFADNWEYDGTTWTDRTPAGLRPSARFDHALAYDAARGKLVLFGGTASIFSAPNNETWELDSGTLQWQLMTPATSPPARYQHAMVYDAKRQRVVLYGGVSQTAIFTETWEYDGVTWVRLFPVSFPPPRALHAMAYDPARERIVMFGGSNGSTELEDTWELDGTTWTAYTPSTQLQQPSIRQAAAMTYDARNQRILMFGGDAAQTPQFTDTWTFGYPSVTADEACHAQLDYDRDGSIGCADDDCWGVCEPLCPPNADTATCPTTPRCGDGACTAVEDCRSCPADCLVGTACPISCGDFFCDSPETAQTCPGDC